MLNETNTQTFTGTSTVDGVVAERYTATIDTKDPENIVITRAIMDSQLRKDNRDKCREDMAQFEDDVYTAQDSMIKTTAKKSKTEA